MTDVSPFITFVLGAGASFEVNMPTGNDLKKKITACLSFKFDNFGHPRGGDDNVREALFQLGQHPEATASTQTYFDAAALIRAAMPQAPSIDNFIDSHRKTPQVAKVGKLAIAAEILRAETSSALYVSPANINNKLNFDRVSDTWYNSFFQLLHLNAQQDDLPERLRRVRVVTFNYDRTLEHFLFHSIQNYYGTSRERAAEILSNLIVYHPYGTVGSLPWQNTGVAVPFGGEISSSALLQVSSGLRTFTEGTSETDSQIANIRSSIFDAEILTFLGFAYHELNLELLFGSPTNSPTKHTKQVFGTAMGLSESNRKAIASELSDYGKYDFSHVTLRSDLSAAQLFPEYSRSLRLPRTA